jgi:S1-C subfamily serine protease
MPGVAGLKTATTANSSKLSVGDKVIAIGNALGQQGTPAVTSGAITALNQTITATDEGAAQSETLSGLIQTDAPLQRGDSGGPLVNTSGQVIGMNTAASGRTPFGSVANQAFAIPINKALTVANQIRAGKASSTIHLGQRPFLGVEIQSNNSGVGGSAPSTPGAVIAGVANNTPAATAGLQGGDVITTFDGKTIDSASALTSAIGTHKPGDSVTVGWVDQAGQHHTATVKLAAGPAD